MTRITIRCSEYEMLKIKEALTDVCPFKVRTIKECGEDSDCHECQDRNIKFHIIESGGE